MKKIITLVTGLLVCVYTLTISPSMASDAFVSAEDEFGQGFFRNRGSECFFITPAHVVEDAVDIELTTSLRKNIEAQVLMKYPSDIAICKVILPDGESCPQSSWGDGEKLANLLTVYKEGVIKTKLNDGSTMQTQVTLKTFDNFGYIQIVPKDPNVSFAKGFSGSPLYIAGETAGMLLSVDNGVGRVFRQDALNNTVALVFGQAEKAHDEPAIKTHVATEKERTDSDVVMVTTKPNTFKGMIAPNQKIEYTFKGVKNSPVLFRFLKFSSSFPYYDAWIINEQKDTVAKYKKLGDSNKEHAFTPQQEGIYTLQLQGYKFHKEFEFSVTQFALNADLTGKANVIKPGDQIKGVIAPDAIAEYTFKGQANTPLVFRFTKFSSSFPYYEALIINEQNDTVAKYKKLGTSNKEHAFTPQQEGIYTLQLHGYKFHKEFEFRLSTLEKG